MCNVPGLRCAAGLLLAAFVPLSLRAQAPQPAPRLTMDEAVRLALDRNQTLRAQRLAIDESKADEITAALKPNFNVSFGIDGLPVFSPGQLNSTTFGTTVAYSAALSYTFERGGKRDKRITAAVDTTAQTSKTVLDAERQTRFQAQQAFINVLLAKSTLEVAQQDLEGFNHQLDINQTRVSAGDLSEVEFIRLKLQRLQFEQDVSSAQISLAQSRATLRQLVGYDTVPDTFDVDGALAYTARAVTLDQLQQDALATRPDLQAAQIGTKVAQDQAALARGNRARDVTGSVDYSRNGFGPVSSIGVGASFDLPFHDRNQGNIAHADVAVRQASEAEAATRATVLTDVVSAFAAYDANDKIVKLYESGYLSQSKDALDITTYAFQRGAASLLDMLDAERTYRDTQIAYRQALAAYMTSVEQLNFVVGKQVVR